jgi:hypothetical protein
MASVESYEKLLLQSFVASFEKLDDMDAVEHIYPIAWQLAVGEPDVYGRRKWRPIEVTTERECVEPIYAELPARFPHLYELLVLSYRWADVDLQEFSLVANPPGRGLSGLLHEISKDEILWNTLRHSGYIQFGKEPDVDYDPVCFDISARRKKGRDYRIVKINHEEILCNNRIKVVKELAPSFEALVRDTISRAGLSVPQL